MSKKTNNITMAVGVALFALAALVTVSLIVGMINFGYYVPSSPSGAVNPFTYFGQALYAVYGFSGFLIPVFLLTAGVFCLDERWSFQRIVCLAISFIPFFTIAFAEHVCRKVAVEDIGPIAVTKILIFMAIAILLAVMEYIIALVCSTASLRAEILPKLIAYKNLAMAKVKLFLKSRANTVKVKETAVKENAEQNPEEAVAPGMEDVPAEEVVEAAPAEDAAEAEDDDPAEPVSDEDRAIEETVARSIDAAVDGMFTATMPNVGTVFNQMQEDAQESADYDEPQQAAAMQDDEPAAQDDGTEQFDYAEKTAEDAETIQADANETEAFEVESESDEDSGFIDDGDYDVVEEVSEEDTDRSITDSAELEEEETSDDYEENSFADDSPDTATEVPADVADKAAVAAQSAPRRNRGPYSIPTDLLTAYEDNPYWIIDEDTNQAAVQLMATLSEFGIKAEVTGICKGPVVTMFEILPAPGVKLSKIANLQDNIALRLAASSVRIVAPIPGKKAVGIEIPNKDRAIVSFRECIEQDIPEWKKMAVPVVLGKDISGEKVVIDLVKTPHLLIAGATGAGKSVCVNSMILSMLYKRSPDQVKMILIDPKIVELKLYNDIPHLLTPVITEPKKAMQALQYCLCEMERRYSLLDGMGVRDISSYNKKIVERRIATEKLPYLIVVIDEFADLMATTGKQLESVLARLAAMSRAVGIHLVLATQRPSIDVITGLIKANIPSRIAFMVASKTDSRIIIDQMGAEKLLGKGDMLYIGSTDPFPVRIQGTFVSDQEVEDVVNAVKQWGEPEYIDDEIFVPDDDDTDAEQMPYNEGEDPLYDKALDIVVQAGKASASYIQRRLKIGYNRAARLVEEMEERGIVGPANGSKPREIIHMP